MPVHSSFCNTRSYPWFGGICDCRLSAKSEPLAKWECDILEGRNPDAHTEGFGEVTFIRTDGRKVVLDNVRVDSIGVDYGLSVVSMEVEGQEAPVHMPFIESWTVEYRL